ncbi:hypothetical protein B9Z19DRAFT_1086937, partial [Tuber borchii]
MGFPGKVIMFATPPSAIIVSFSAIWAWRSWCSCLRRSRASHICLVLAATVRFPPAVTRPIRTSSRRRGLETSERSIVCSMKDEVIMGVVCGDACGVVCGVVCG